MLKSALLDECDRVLRSQGKAKATRQTYRKHLESFLKWGRWKHGEWKHPKDMGKEGVERWLSDLANIKNVAPTTQNVALQAALYLFREVLKSPLEGVESMRARRPQLLPVVLSIQEVRKILASLTGRNLLIAKLLYGSGLRIGEAISLRLKDIDFDRRQIVVRAAKGAKDRAVPMPLAIIDDLLHQVEQSKKMHAKDTRDGTCRVEVPFRYAEKNPRSPYSLEWYWLFPSAKLSRHPDEHWIGRYHLDHSNFGRMLGIVAQRSEILKPCTPHKLRHAFATHSHESGMSLASLQALLGHNDLRTTQIYLHSAVDGPTGQTSPLDRILI